MKKRAAAILMLLGYSVPYAFLAMYGDAQLRTMWLYLPLLAGMTLLCLAFSALGFMVTVSLIALSAQLLAYFLGVRRARKRMEPLR